MTPPASLTGQRPFVPLGLQSRPAGERAPARRVRIPPVAAPGGAARSTVGWVAPGGPPAAPLRLAPLLDWAEGTDERGTWARTGARVWAAARLVMLAGALAVGGTLGLLLAAMRLYSWLRHSRP